MAVGQVGGDRRSFAGRFLATAVLVVAGARSQCPVTAAVPTIESLSLAATYGDGVHAYFAGDYQRSYDDLSQVIEAGSADPRAYYFRGLTALKMGRLDESEADFSAGAAREADGTGTWPVSRSLERVQGCDRLKLERHRTRARVAVVQDDRRRNQRRYLDVERGEPDVLRRRRPETERAVEEANPFEGGQNEAERVPAAEEMPEPKAADEGEAKPADEGFGAADRPAQASEQVEQLAAEREDVAEQRDQQAEQGVSELENAADQRDAQAEAEAAR